MLSFVRCLISQRQVSGYLICLLERFTEVNISRSSEYWSSKDTPASQICFRKILLTVIKTEIDVEES